MSSSSTPFNNSGDAPLPCGITVIVAFFVLHLLLVAIPAWSYFQYDLVATELHLEEPRELADEAVVQANRAIGLVNCIWVIPLNVVAIVGLLPFCRGRRIRGRNGSNGCCTFCSTTTTSSKQHTIMPPTWAFTTSCMLLGIAIYWPIQYICSRITYTSANIDHVPLRGSDLGMLTVVLVLSLWSICYLSSCQSTTMIAINNSSPANHLDTAQTHHQNYDATPRSNENAPLVGHALDQ